MTPVRRPWTDCVPGEGFRLVARAGARRRWREDQLDRVSRPTRDRRRRAAFPIGSVPQRRIDEGAQFVPAFARPENALLRSEYVRRLPAVEGALGHQLL